ncbi:MULTISPECIES: hypothetical protein [Candidatus Nitrosocaldus]|jgi:RNase P/RNase MRP subunit POP5|uniref:Uncharacterized protein n=1 Tax=Candidatus Nitrosocaldus cavascurensis TaxID=2058097 RepID=A0A2K5API4_9ARCH|nr:MULTISPECIES: hypothetical protein [Candidatus Nitrosocaldus]SPC33519.1 protein of unknown function [Candidatus Nitrosocaldus cavascurensis]
MRYKKRYILVYVDAHNPYGYQRKMLKMIRDAYAEIFGSKEVDEARITFVSYGSRRRNGSSSSSSSRDGNAADEMGKIHGAKIGEEVGKADVSRGYIHAHRTMLPLIIRCNLEHYGNVMHILSILGIRTVTTSGTLKALRRRQGLIGEERKIDGDEVRAAPG